MDVSCRWGLLFTCWVSDPKPAPKRQMRRLLKKEVSLDTYTWQKKYAHLTSNLVIPAVDERFKRRFSVSASMEEISKIPQNKEAQVCFSFFGDCVFVDGDGWGLF